MLTELLEEPGARKYLDLIGYNSLRTLIEAELNRIDHHGIYFQEANKVAEVLTGILKKKKLMSTGSSSAFVDVLLAACFLRDLYTDGAWTSVFYAREKLADTMKQNGITREISDAIFQTIEAQLGDDMPVPNCRPIPNSPTQDFAMAVWFVTEFNQQEEE